MLLKDLIILYISYEIRIADTFSYAAENIMRQQITREAIKKIDEIEVQQITKERKEKKYRSFQKLIEVFSRSVASRSD